MFNLIVEARAMENIFSPSRSEHFSTVGDLIALNISIQCSSRNLNVIYMQKNQKTKETNKQTTKQLPVYPPSLFLKIYSNASVCDSVSVDSTPSTSQIYSFSICHCLGPVHTCPVTAMRSVSLLSSLGLR